MTGLAVGRWVHYTSHGTPGGEYTKQCRAALVTEVEAPSVDADHEGRAGLMVCNPTGLFFHSLLAGGCGYDGAEDPKGGTWHWPERV